MVDLLEKCGDVAMVLVDTSAWVEYLRNTGSPECMRVGGLLAAGLAARDTVRMEL